MVRGKGYLRSKRRHRMHRAKAERGIPVLVGDVARIEVAWTSGAGHRRA